MIFAINDFPTMGRGVGVAGGYRPSQGSVNRWGEGGGAGHGAGHGFSYGWGWGHAVDFYADCQDTKPPTIRVVG